jgi:uncharacterized protein (DUF58 family)
VKPLKDDRVNKFVNTLRERQPSNGSGIKVPAPVPVRAADAPVNGAKNGSAKPTPAFFDPQVLAKLGHLDLISKSVVDGFLSGKHRSTHKGGCTDFAEFRPYARGDSIRLLDWRHYARSDRYYVKRYEDETNLQALLIVDASGSMNFGISTVSKWRYAQMAAASLAHLLLRQRDSAGMALVANGVLDYVKPQPRANHLARMLDMMGSAQPGGASSLADVLAGLSGRLKRRGMVILLSDCFGDVPALKHVLEQFCFRGHDVIVAQILAPEELTFPFRREAFFQDLELHGRMQVNPNTVRKAYLKEFQAFMDELHKACTDIGADLMTFKTSDDLGEVLAYYLHRRAAMKNPHRAMAGR